MTRLVGNTASAAALASLRQLSKGGSVARDGERLLSVPQLLVFLRGFPYAVFPRAAPGSHGSPAYFPEMMLRAWIAPLHPRAELGSGVCLPCLQSIVWVLSTFPPIEQPSS